MGICGSCGMFINGRPRLACNTQIAELDSDVVTVGAAAQLRHHQGPGPGPAADVRDPPRADAVPAPRRHAGAGRPDRGVLADAARAGAVPAVQLLHQVRLLHGGLPHGARPTRSTPGRCRSARRTATTATRRDGGFDRRREVLAGGSGPWRCHFAGECSQVCPKGVDPAKAIQLMKRELVSDLLRLRRRRPPAARGRGAPRHETRGHPAASGSDRDRDLRRRLRYSPSERSTGAMRAAARERCEIAFLASALHWPSVRPPGGSAQGSNSGS